MIINYSQYDRHQIIDSQTYLIYNIGSSLLINIRGISSYTKHNSDMSYTKNKSNMIYTKHNSDIIYT